MDDPQTPTPPAPPEAIPWWRRVAELADPNIDQDIDAVSSAAGRARDWIQAKLPHPPPAGPERQAGADAALKAWQDEQTRKHDAAWEPITRFFGRPTVQAIGQQLYDDNKDQWTPSHDTQVVTDLARQHITEHSDAVRAALPKAPTTISGGTEGPFRGLSATVDPMAPLNWAVGAHEDWIPNLAVDQLAQSTTPVGAALNVVEPIGPALKGVGAAAHLAGVVPPGFFSRVDQLLEQIGKKGIHPNKLASLLKSQASSEEVAYRGLPEFLASKGNQLITKDELAAHLAAHPPPQITRSVLGASTDPAYVHAARDLIAHGHTPDTALPALQQAYRGAPEADLRDAIDAARGLDPVGAPKYSSYTLPGGERYQESLTQLSPEHPRLQALRDQLQELVAQPSSVTTYRGEDRTAAYDRIMDEFRALGGQPRAPVYQSSHFDQPNILVHTRTNERTLPVTRPTALPEHYQVHQDRNGKYYYQTPDGSGGVEDYATAEQATRAAMAHAGQLEPERGLWMEEAQSDWNQQGKRVGYRQPIPGTSNLTWNDYARAKGIAPEEASQVFGDVTDPRFNEWFNSHQEAVDIANRNVNAVPDNPFKETWPDLAIKQHLLDVAHRQDLSWLGWTSGQTQAARYDLAKQVSKIKYSPVERRLMAYDHGGAQVISEHIEPDELADHIGKEPADKLIEKINAHGQARQWERDPWSVGHDTDDPAFFHIYDPNGEPVHTYDGALEWFRTEQGAQDRIDELLNESHEDMRQSAARDGDPYLPTLSGLDLQVGGEGMNDFYDQRFRRRVEKIVQPFGGSVEPTAVPAGTKMQPTTVTKYRLVDPRGQWALPSYKDFTSEAEATRLARVLEAGSEPFLRVEAYQAPGEVEVPHTEPGWITRLSPEQKAAMREKGFSLMSLLPPALAAGAAGAAASQLGGDDPDHPGGGAAVLGAALPFALPRGGGSLAAALKRTGMVGEYALREPIIERLAQLYAHGKTLPPSSWGGPEVTERLLQGFDNDPDLTRQWGRLWGATSPNTSVPVNTRESASALAHALLHPADQHLTYMQARRLPGAQITMAGSKVGNINLARNDLPLSGDKVEAMAGFMTGRPRIPIDVHALYALDAAHDKLDKELPGLRALMTHTEGLPQRSGLTNTDLYHRTEDAIARALQRIAPRQDPGATFAQLWEGARHYKGLAEQGAPADILGQQQLLRTGALLDPERIRAALGKPGWIYKSDK